MPTSRATTSAPLTLVAGALAAAFVSVAVAADAPGTYRAQPGQWNTQSRIWMDGKAVIRGPESESDRAQREALARGRAQMSAEERAAIDRILPPGNSVAKGSVCVTAAAPHIDTRAVLREALREMHTPPWSCTYSGEQTIVRGYLFDYVCTTPAGGRAEGKARAMMNATAGYTLSIEGRAHLVDPASGRPLESRMVDARMNADAGWSGPACATGAAQTR